MLLVQFYYQKKLFDE